MKLKPFQKQDLARAALHNGLILSWDTGLGKTWALYLWALLKLGYVQEAVTLLNYLKPGAAAQAKCAFSPNAIRLRPKAPVLIIAPGDLHQQIIDEGWERFGIAVYPLDSQATFERLTCGLHSARSNLDEQGRPILPPDFYITSYTQLTTNGVERIPDVRDWADPVALRQLLCLHHGDHVGLDAVTKHCEANDLRWPDWTDRPEFATTCEFFAWREVKWRDCYATFNTNATDATLKSLQTEYERQLDQLAERRDQEQAEKERITLAGKYEILQHLCADQPDPKLRDLAPAAQDFVLKHFLHDFCVRGGAGEGETKSFVKLSDGQWRSRDTVNAVKQTGKIAPDAPTEVATWKIKCVYSPSLSDLSYNAFRAVVIDEGVKMKGADTYVGLGVRQMDPEYRLVLTATPIKNRVPDLFWLAHWATGGRDEAHARFPYANDNAEQTKFAETFMVSENNLTKAEEAKGKSSPGRFKKLTAEVCNVHRLWKLLGPILLRRRKDDCGEDIVPKVRRVVRCQMGTLQSKVYAYHLKATYVDKNGDDAIGARLQSLRQAAADPTCDLPVKPGDTSEPCACTLKPVPPEEQVKRLQSERDDLLKAGTVSPSPRGDAESHGERAGVRCKLTPEQERLQAIDHELANPVQRFDTIEANPKCQHCHGDGTLPLPHRSGNSFIPKHASVLNLVNEILQRGEQVVIGAAFNAPLDVLSGYLDQAGVRHLKLDGRTSQKRRGTAAQLFKRGRVRNSEAGGPHASVPVMLAGVECMAEGHSFHLANNVILLAYSWAYDKFIQFINRVHRMTSAKPVNVYVVVCDGTIDQRLESLIGEKGDSSELVLDGRLIGERSEEVNLAELLKVAHREFDANSDTIDEALIHAQWPRLRDELRTAQAHWDAGAPTAEVGTDRRAVPSPSAASGDVRGTRAPAPESARGTAQRTIPTAATTSLRYNPATGKYTVVTETKIPLPPPPPVLADAKTAAPKRSDGGPAQSTNHPQPSTDWRSALKPRAKRPMLVRSNNPWDNL